MEGDTASYAFRVPRDADRAHGRSLLGDTGGIRVENSWELYKDNKWVGLPQKKAKKNADFHETELYTGWVNIANKVTNAITKKHKAGIKGRWIDCNHLAPKSQTTDAPSLRPDIAFVSVHADVERIKEHGEQLQTHDHYTRLQARNKQLKAIISQLWWLQMIGFGEFKVKTEDQESAFRQLCTYVKQAFREQLNRCFIIGFTLCYDELNIYLFDRSGVSGVDKSINIHKHPEKLIKLIAYYTVLKPENLGFDPTMKIYSPLLPDTQNPRDSWTMPLPKLEDHPDLYECQWVIKGAAEEYITIRTLSIINSEMMCGRGTTVWEVVRYKEFKENNKDKNPEVLVLKQSWQRTPGLHPSKDVSALPFEFITHARAEIASTRIQEATYIKSPRDGRIISTMELIRGGLTGPLRHASWISKREREFDVVDDVPSSADPQVHSSGTSEGRKRPRTDPGDQEPFQHQGSLPVEPDFERVKPVDRKLTRIIMKTRGWPLKHFKDLGELLQIFYDAIDDHKRFYYRGVLHRDVSAGNIVILIPPNDGRSGCLIDLDHAKMTGSVDDVKPTFFEHKYIGDRLQAAAQRVKVTLADDESTFVEESTAKAAVKACGTQAVSYLATVTKRFEIKSTPDRPIKLSDLHWDLPLEIPPSFQDYSAGDGVRTGTLPYMSHQIVAGKSVVHDAIHDIESFFWVLVYMALTRAGPGTRNNNPPQKLLDSHFNNDGVAKTSMEELSEHFHTYFKDLKPFIKRWQKVIQTAYQFKAYELWTIHEYSKALIHETMIALDQAGVNSSPELTSEEEARRKAYHLATETAIQKHISVPDTEQHTPEKAPQRVPTAQRAEEPETPTRDPKAKRLKSGRA